MFSHTKNSFGCYLFLACACLLFVFSGCRDFKNQSVELERARVLIREWRISDAREVLSKLYEHDQTNKEIKTNLAEAFFLSGELYSAKRLLVELIEEDSTNRSNNQIKLAKVYYFLGKLDSSEYFVNEILKQIQPGTKPEILSTLLNFLGRIEFNKGEYKLAEYYQQQSLKYALEAGSKNSEADALRQIGVLEWYAGNHENVISKYYLPALQLYRECNDLIGEATTISNIGLIYNLHGNWIENIAHQLESFNIRKKIGDKIGLSDSYYFLTLNIPHRDKGREFAYKFLLKSYELSSRIGYAWGKEVALRSLIDIRAEAVDDYDIAFSKVDSVFISSFEGKIHRIWNKAKRYAKLEDYYSSAAYYKQGIELSDSQRYYTGIEAPLIDYSDVLLALGEFEQAEEVISRVVARTLKLNRADSYAESLYSLAKLYDLKNEKRKAGKLYSRLINFYDSLYIEKLNEVYPSLAFEAATGAVHYMRSKIYRSYFETLIDLEKYDDAFVIVEKERLLPFWGEREYETASPDSSADNSIVRLIDLINAFEKRLSGTLESSQAELDSIYKLLLVKKGIQFNVSSEYLNRQPVKLDELAELLKFDEVLLEFFITNNSVYSFVVKSGNMKVIQTDADINSLSAIIDVYNETIKMGSVSPSDSLWKGPSRKLYNLLFKPIEDLLTGSNVTKIYISPHQFLHFIPFNSLIRFHENEEKFLVEDFQITYIPSATHFRNFRNNHNKTTGSISLFAPDGNSLPFTQREAKFISSLPIESKNLFFGSDATINNFWGVEASSEIVHVASHGVINRKFPLHSYIALADGKLELYDILETKRKSQLVFLSACEAGLSIGEMGIYPSGHDMVSFPRAFISSGASMVVSPMWLLEDESAYEFVKLFYSNLILNNSVQISFTKALTDAQRDLIKLHRIQGSNPNPFTWASFFITGVHE